MGACDISFKVDGKANFSEVKQAFKLRQRIDNDNNGNGGYSGDFQTVEKVLDHSCMKSVFDDFNSAMEYCLNTAEKWTSAVAVKYKSENGQLNWLIAGWGAC